MKNTILATTFLLFTIQKQVNAQNENKTYFDRVILGTSLTVIPDNYPRPITGEDYLYLEYTWNTNFALDISRRWRVGFQYLKTHSKSPVNPPQKYFMTGTFLQFNFLPKDRRRDRLYIEASYNLGNQCLCGILEPYKMDNIRYYGLGLGGDLKLTKWLRLDFGFFNYQILNKIEGKYNWTQYVIGLEFPFSIKK